MYSAPKYIYPNVLQPKLTEMSQETAQNIDLLVFKSLHLMKNLKLNNKKLPKKKKNILRSIFHYSMAVKKPIVESNKGTICYSFFFIYFE